MSTILQSFVNPGGPVQPTALSIINTANLLIDQINATGYSVGLYNLPGQPIAPLTHIDSMSTGPTPQRISGLPYNPQVNLYHIV